MYTHTCTHTYTCTHIYMCINVYRWMYIGCDARVYAATGLRRTLNCEARIHAGTCHCGAPILPPCESLPDTAELSATRSDEEARGSVFLTARRVRREERGGHLKKRGRLANRRGLFRRATSPGPPRVRASAMANIKPPMPSDHSPARSSTVRAYAPHSGRAPLFGGKICPPLPSPMLSCDGGLQQPRENHRDRESASPDEVY